MRLALAIIVAGTWLSTPLLFGATATPAPTTPPPHHEHGGSHPHGSGDTHPEATPVGHDTSRDSGHHDSGTDDGTLQKLFRSLDDSHRDHGDHPRKDRPRPRGDDGEADRDHH